MVSTTGGFAENIAATIRSLSAEPSVQGNAWVPVSLLITIMKKSGETLLAERSRHFNANVRYDEQQPIDRQVHKLVEDELDRSTAASRDELVSEEARPLSDKAGPRIWILDPLDNSKAYLDPSLRTDYGSALMVCDRGGNVIASSFILPAEGTVYFSAGSKAWRDGQALVDLRVLPATGARLAVVREPREGLPPDIKEHYQRVKGNLERNQYKLIPGEILTALDILSLAEGKGPTVFLYYGKPHDVLVAASVAHAAGATVTDQATGEDVFPLAPALVEKARKKERVLFCVRSPCLRSSSYRESTSRRPEWL